MIGRLETRSERSSSPAARVLIVTAGWYGLGNIRALLGMVRLLRRENDVRVALFTLPFEAERLERTGESDVFNAIYTGVPGEENEYLAYIARTLTANRLALQHAVAAEQPTVVVTHWMMLIELLTGVTTSSHVIAVLEESEWGKVTAGSPSAKYFGYADEVVFADSWRPYESGPPPAGYAGCLSDFALEPVSAEEIEASRVSAGVPRSGRLIVVNSGGGAYTRTGTALTALAAVAGVRPHDHFLFVIGPLFRAAHRTELLTTLASLPNVTVVTDPSRRTLECYVAACDLLICSGGTNSVAEGVAYGKPVLVVNANGSPSENDLSRLREFERRGMLTITDTDEGLDRLADLVARSGGTPPIQGNGSPALARLVLDRARGRPVKAREERHVTVMVYLPSVTTEVRRRLYAHFRARGRTLTFECPRSWADDTLSFETAVAAFHELITTVAHVGDPTLVVASEEADTESALLSDLLIPVPYVFVSSSMPMAAGRVAAHGAHAHLEQVSRSVADLLGLDARVVEPQLVEYPPDLVHDGFTPFDGFVAADGPGREERP